VAPSATPASPSASAAPTSAPTAAPAASPTSAPALSGRKATVVLGKDMRSELGMDPARAYEQIDFLVLGNAYSRLVRFPTGADGYPDFTQLQGDLADSWTVSPDAKTLSFKLKSTPKFASGSLLTAEDVRFSYMRLKNVKGTAGFLASNIDTVESPDAGTVVIKLLEPDPGFLKSLTSANFAVTEAAVVKANGGTDAADADTKDTAENFLSTQTVGSGPFKMTQYDRGQKIVLQRVDDWWGGPPAAIEQFIVQNIPEPELQAAALERGDIDMTWSLIGQPDLIQRLTGGGFILEKKPTLEYYVILFTADPKNNPAVANEKVQLALKYAIDYDGLTKICPVGSTRMAGIAPEFVGGFSPSDPDAIHEDLDKAKTLLAEAGYAKGFDVTYSGFKIGGICPTHEEIAIKLAQDWARIGVRVKVDFKDFEQAIGPIRSGDIQIANTGWIADYPDPINYAKSLVPLSAFAKRARFSELGTPKPDPTLFPSYSQLVALSKQMLSETDPAKALDLFHQTEVLSAKASALYPTLTIDVAMVGAPDLTGFHYNVLYYWDLYQLGRK
jgi:peptide/nickel transport system substrate-binding protein